MTPVSGTTVKRVRIQEPAPTPNDKVIDQRHCGVLHRNTTTLHTNVAHGIRLRALKRTQRLQQLDIHLQAALDRLRIETAAHECSHNRPSGPREPST